MDSHQSRKAKIVLWAHKRARGDGVSDMMGSELAPQYGNQMVVFASPLTKYVSGD